MKKTLLLRLLLLPCFYAVNAQQVTESVAEVQNMIAFTTSPVAQTDVNTYHTLHYHYTLAQQSIVKVTLSKYHRSGMPMVPISQYIINPAAITTETPVSASTPLSSQLINDQYYQWDAEILTAGSVLVTGVYSRVTIGNPLHTSSFNKRSLSVYPNPVSNLLYLPEGNDIRKVFISDQSGRIVLAQNNNNPIDVSSLRSGIYFLTSDQQQTVKFVRI